MPIPVCQVPVGSYFSKPFRAYVLLKPRDKFTGCKSHLLLFSLIGIIFIIKSNGAFSIIDTEYPVIAVKMAKTNAWQ